MCAGRTRSSSAAETVDFLAGIGVTPSGEQAPKTRKALEFFAAQRRALTAAHSSQPRGRETHPRRVEIPRGRENILCAGAAKLTMRRGANHGAPRRNEEVPGRSDAAGLERVHPERVSPEARHLLVGIAPRYSSNSSSKFGNHLEGAGMGTLIAEIVCVVVMSVLVLWSVNWAR